MFRNNVYTFKNLPVEEKLRKRTDCCCTIIGALLALTLFILSFVLFRRGITMLIQPTITRSTTLPIAMAILATTTTKTPHTSILPTLTTSQPEGIAYRPAPTTGKPSNARPQIKTTAANSPKVNTEHTTQ